MHRKRRPHGPFGIFLVGLWHAKDGQDGVANVFSTAPP